MPTFQQTILTLQDYWGRHGCALLQPYDMEVGAGTSHTATFLRALGPEPWRAAYVQPSRRPKDGRYGENPNRLHQHHQFQVVLKPAPADILDLYLGSLEALGFDLSKNDVRFVEDDWENPTLGAWGLGWEVWLNGMEITQFTYFQQVGSLDCNPITGEITYGLERMSMYLQDVESVYDLRYTESISYGDVFFQNEVEQSKYAFDASDAAKLFDQFAYFEGEAKRLLDAKLPLPGYEMILKAGHTFNLLDARGAISVTERAGYIGRIRALSRQVATAYVEAREALGFPMLAERERATLPAQYVKAATAGAPMSPPGRPKGEYRSAQHEGPVSAATLVVELYTEELPPKALRRLGEAFAGSMVEGLRARGLLAGTSVATSYATPRRLAVAVTQVLAVAPDSEVIDKLMPAKVARGADGAAHRSVAQEAWRARARATGNRHARCRRRSGSHLRRIGRQGGVCLPAAASPRVRRSQPACRRRSTTRWRSCRSRR